MTRKEFQNFFDDFVKKENAIYKSGVDKD